MCVGAHVGHPRQNRSHGHGCRGAGHAVGEVVAGNLQRHSAGHGSHRMCMLPSLACRWLVVARNLDEAHH